MDKSSQIEWYYLEAEYKVKPYLKVLPSVKKTPFNKRVIQNYYVDLETTR